MIYRNHTKEQFWHRFPKDRTFLEKIARRFIFPDYHDSAFTIGGWKKYRARLKSRFPVRWFISETIPDKWADWVVVPKNKVFQWFLYNVKHRFHVVNTDLKPGYHDPDVRMLHAAFQLLVDYVEIELASMQKASLEAEENPGESSKAYYSRLTRFRRKAIRNPKAGLKYLDWEINESPGSHMVIGSTTQANAAKEKKFLYTWWTQYRPARIDLYQDKLIWSGHGYDPGKDCQEQDCSWQYHLVTGLEKLYNAEDTEMFHRLVEIRHSMWI